jgi:hypothetical protein
MNDGIPCSIVGRSVQLLLIEHVKPQGDERKQNGKEYRDDQGELDKRLPPHGLHSEPRRSRSEHQ